MSLPAIEELKNKYDKSMIKSYFQLLQVTADDWYYLNPELVPNQNEVTLCPKCFNNPLDHKYSIANGHDYGIISSLPTLNKPSQNSISLLRLFGSAIHINEATCSGHCISFESDGPHVCANRVLPALEAKASVHVTFVGTKDQWRIARNQYKNLY